LVCDKPDANYLVLFDNLYFVGQFAALMWGAISDGFVVFIFKLQNQTFIFEINNIHLKSEFISFF